MAKYGRFELAAGLLVLALLIGGAGVNFPILDMLLGLAAIGVAAVLVWRRQATRLPLSSRLALALVGLMLLLPLLQLVPLPPSLWQALPGRAVPAQIDALLGLSVWRPWTLDVEGTVRAFLNLLPASAMVLACIRLRSPDRARLLMVVVGFAGINALLGIMQLASGGGMTPYPSTHSGYPIGLFVNRNHNAVFLLMAMPVIAALAANRAEHSSSRGALVAGTLSLLTILAVVIIATTSRMALLLLPLAFGGALLLLFFRRSLWRLAIPSTLALAVIAGAISWLGGLSRNLARFSSLHDSRFDYWTDVHWALDHYGLAGTGFGTFIPLYQTAESLSSVGPAILNHAHNDFIEILLEGGIPAMTLVVAFFVWLALVAVQLVRARFDRRRALFSLAALLSVTILLIFSLVDYPLRMPAISCVFALLCACLLPEPQASADAGDARSTGPGRHGRGAGRGAAVAPRVALLGGLALVALLQLQAGVSASSLLANRFADARAWASWSTAAHEGLASDALAGGQSRVAIDEARAALRLSPIDSVAVRTLALAGASAGALERPERLMEVAVLLGWRDPVTQLWAIAASEQTGEPDKAVQRAQALFQQELFPAPAITLLLRDAPDGPTTRALLGVLATRPAWRPAFIRAGAALPGSELGGFVQLAARLNNGASPMSAGEAEPLLTRLIDSSRTDEARGLWTAIHRRALIANGGFEEVASRNGADVPADWNIADEDLATVTVQAPPGSGDGRALRISSGARSGPLISQRLLLAPGDYVLSYRVRAGDGAPAGSAGTILRWQLRCASSDLGTASQQAVAPGAGWQKLAAGLTVPIQDCPIQTLAVQRPDGIQAPELWIDDLVLARISDLRRVH